MTKGFRLFYNFLTVYSGHRYYYQYQALGYEDLSEDVSKTPLSTNT